MIRMLLLVLTLAPPAFANAPETSRTPELRPDDAPGLRALEAGPEQGPPVPPPLPARLSQERLAQCSATLTDLGAVFTPAEDITRDAMRGCAVFDPVTVSEVAGIAVEPPATMTCPTAEAFARWTRDFVAPAADALNTRGALTGIRQYGTYSCRNVNNAATGRRSQHSFGRAIDVSGFVFEDGSVIPVAPHRRGSPEQAFQGVTRAAACLTFSTVIGPGGDAFHDDHLHMDTAPRRSAFRYCR
ncbi:MAG: extensin-like domain-containing protein [Shimia sp.]